MKTILPIWIVGGFVASVIWPWFGLLFALSILGLMIWGWIESAIDEHRHPESYDDQCM